MVGRDVGVGAAQHLVLSKPLLVVGAQLPQDPEAISGVEDVVDYSFEVIPVTHKQREAGQTSRLSECTGQVSDSPFSSPTPPHPTPMNDTIRFKEIMLDIAYLGCSE